MEPVLDGCYQTDLILVKQHLSRIQLEFLPNSNGGGVIRGVMLYYRKLMNSFDLHQFYKDVQTHLFDLELLITLAL